MIFLDFVFTLAHIAVILFNLTGWIWPRTRKIHLAVVALTAGSWLLLGPFKGWGYCFLTDWHWRVKENLGETGLPNSFIKYFADKLSGSDINSTLVDSITAITFIVIVIITIYVNFLVKSGKVRD